MQYLNSVLWILTVGTIVAILFGLHPLQNTEQPASQVANSLWLALIRNNWGYAIAWIIFACQHGTGGIIKWFLELPCWRPLGRMSLSFYLVHSIYQTVAIGSGRVPLHFNHRSLVNRQIDIERTNFEFYYRHPSSFQLHNYAGDFVVSFFLATLLYLTVEEPILLIETYIYKQLAVKRTNK